MNKYRSISLNGDHGRGMNGQIIEIINVKIQLYKLKMIQYSLQPHPLESFKYLGFKTRVESADTTEDFKKYLAKRRKMF